MACCTQEKEDVGGKYSKQKMVLGTHTSEGEQNYLMLAEVRDSIIWKTGVSVIHLERKNPIFHLTRVRVGNSHGSVLASLRHVGSV